MRSGGEIRMVRGVCGFLVVILGIIFLHGFPSAAFAQQAEGQLAKRLIEEGITAYQQGQYEEAETKLTQARTLLPSHSPTALYLGLTYLQQGKTDKAIAAWQEYIQLQPYTEQERQAKLPQTIPQYLTLLLREENHRLAREAIVQERQLV